MAGLKCKFCEATGTAREKNGLIIGGNPSFFNKNKFFIVAWAIFKVGLDQIKPQQVLFCQRKLPQKNWGSYFCGRSKTGLTTGRRLSRDGNSSCIQARTDVKVILANRSATFLGAILKTWCFGGFARNSKTPVKH